jgi:uncharacterized protein YlxP (DUF503 family)
MKTCLALLHLEFRILQAESLKDKRRMVKSFKDRVAGKFNVSISEVDSLDNRHRAVLAVAMVSGDQAYMAGALQQIIIAAAGHRDMILIASEIEWF